MQAGRELRDPDDVVLGGRAVQRERRRAVDRLRGRVGRKGAGRRVAGSDLGHKAGRRSRHRQARELDGAARIEDEPEAAQEPAERLIAVRLRDPRRRR